MAKKIIVLCDTCLTELPLNEPILVKQVAITLVHPDGTSDAIQTNNDPNGCFFHYCAKCVAEGNIPHVGATEQENIRTALLRKQQAVNASESALVH